MSDPRIRQNRDTALEDALRRIRVLERNPTSALMPNIHFRQDLDGVTFSDSTVDTDKISFGSLLLPPINNGGTVDTSIFDITGGGPWDHVPILEPGLYYGEARCGWFRDWGTFRINLQYEHSNGESFPISDSYGFSDSMPSEPGVTFNPIPVEIHEQTAVCRRGFILIDEYAFTSSGTVSIYTTTTNTGGANRTFNSTTNQGGATLYLMRLSPSCHSNP